jgi:hypothetical protein
MMYDAMMRDAMMRDAMMHVVTLLGYLSRKQSRTLPAGETAVLGTLNAIVSRF